MMMSDTREMSQIEDKVQSEISIDSSSITESSEEGLSLNAAFPGIAGYSIALDKLKELYNTPEFSPFIKNQIEIDGKGKLRIHQEFVEGNKKDLAQILFENEGIKKPTAIKMGLDLSGNNTTFVSRNIFLEGIHHYQQIKIEKEIRKLLTKGSLSEDLSKGIKINDKTDKLVFRYNLDEDKRKEILQVVYEVGGLSNSQARLLELNHVPEKIKAQPSIPKFKQRGLLAAGKLLRDRGFRYTKPLTQLLEDLIIEEGDPTSYEKTNTRFYIQESVFEKVLESFGKIAYDKHLISLRLANSTGNNIIPHAKKEKKQKESLKGMETTSTYLTPMFGSKQKKPRLELIRMLEEDAKNDENLQASYVQRGNRTYVNSERFSEIKLRLVQNLYDQGEIGARKAHKLGVEGPYEDYLKKKQMVERRKTFYGRKRSAPRNKNFEEMLENETGKPFDILDRAPEVSNKFMTPSEFHNEYARGMPFNEFQEAYLDQKSRNNLFRRMCIKTVDGEEVIKDSDISRQIILGIDYKFFKNE